MGGGSSPPPAPDYTAAAKEEGAQNLALVQAQTMANRPNQTNQYGSSTWTQDPTTGQWSNQVSLNPTLQNIFNQQTGMMGQATSMAGGLLSDYQNNWQQGQNTMQGILNQAQQINPASATAAFMSQMQPYLDKQNSAMNASLAAQGMAPGGEAWGQGQTFQSMNQNNAEAQAIINSGTLAQQQMSQLQGQYAMAQALQTNPLQQYESLMSGNTISGTPQFQSFTNAGVSSAPDLVGAEQATYQAQMDQYNANKSSSQGIGGMLGTIVGGVAGSIVPGVGTVAGMGLGGAAGGLMGSMF